MDISIDLPLFSYLKFRITNMRNKYILMGVKMLNDSSIECYIVPSSISFFTGKK